ncbi:MAG: hypothetical protein IIC03_04455 [Proteobacteria bacterium]|nr:hypothetical protein [Pseudomonadota bacterium]
MVKLTEVASHLGLSVTRVSQLISADILPKAPRGRHDLAACRLAYLEHLREIAAGRGSRDGGLDLVAERARLARAQAEKVERENKIADGLYLEVAVVHRLVTGSFARVRAKLLASPARLAPVMAPAMSPAAAQGVLKTEIYTALNELGSTQITGITDTGDLTFTEVTMEREQ